MMRAALLLSTCIACLVVPAATAQPSQDAPAQRITVRSQTDLPPLTYALSKKPSELLVDDAAFAELAGRVRTDLDHLLATYDIQDRTTLVGLYATLRDLALLGGDADQVRSYSARLRDLQEKPADRWLAGVRTGAYAAALAAGDDSQARDQAIEQHMERTFAEMPWAVVRNQVKEMRSSVEVLSHNVITGIVGSRLDPVHAASGSLSRELVAQLANIKVAHDFMVPHAAAQLAAIDAYIAANDIRKPDIWQARDVPLDTAEGLTPVVIGIWDSGVDVSLFPDRLHINAAEQLDGLDNDGNGYVDDLHGIAFDLDITPGPDLLLPLPPQDKAREDVLYGYLKGSLDNQYQVDSPQAQAFRAHIGSLQPGDVGPFMEDMSLYFNHVHGTHVAGVAMEGNPAARLLVARDTFPHQLVPPPFTRDRAADSARMYRAIVDYMKVQGARVVNMSWIWTPIDIERNHEANGLGETPEQRRAEALAIFKVHADALMGAIRNAPDILFVPAAGNSDDDVDFIGAIPAGIDLPNVLTVGAVDRAGDETGFTSHGRLVRVHANGHEVDGPVPGGRRMHWHGTSLAAPQVVNLAAKLWAVDPSLTVADVVALILDGAEQSEDGRRNLIHPRRSMDLLLQRAR